MDPNPDVIRDATCLGRLAMQFRGTRSDTERREIARSYAETVSRLIASGSWNEMPAFEDQLPDDWMPDTFFDYWAPRPGRS
jgi:hypothetical protein